MQGMRSAVGTDWATRRRTSPWVEEEVGAVASRTPAEQPVPQVSGEDLFQEQSRDEQFEIPAFLRRQSN